MTMNDKLERNLLKLFSNFKTKIADKPGDQDYFIEPIGDDSITIKETDKSGEGQITFTFKNGHFIRFSKKMIGDNSDVFFNQRKNFTLRRICDGIFLVQIESKVMLCFVELKKKIDNKNFMEAIKQIEGSYLKTAMFLSLLADIKELGIAVFIAGGLEKIKADADIDYSEKVLEFSEEANNPEAKLKEFSHKKKVDMNFPFFLDKEIDIHENYKKENIKVYHVGFDDTFDMQKAFMI